MASAWRRVIALLVEMPVLEWATPAAASLFVSFERLTREIVRFLDDVCRPRDVAPAVAG